MRAGGLAWIALSVSLACRPGANPEELGQRRSELLRLADERAGGAARFRLSDTPTATRATTRLPARLAREVESSALRQPSSAARVDLALLRLAQGRTGEAIDLLQGVADEPGTTNPAVLLAAAHLTRATIDDDPLDLLAAAEILLGLPEEPLVTANLELARERLQAGPEPEPRQDALDLARVAAFGGLTSWMEAAVGGDAAGAETAVAQLREAAATLRAAAGDRETELLLASLSRWPGEQRRHALAIQTYFAGYREFDAYRIEAAEGSLRAARRELEPFDSPFLDWADLYLQACRFHRRQLDGVAEAAARIGQEAAASGRRTLAGRAFWLQGLTLLHRGLPIEARPPFERSATHLRAVRSHALTAFVEGLYAEASALLGETRAAWRGRLRAVAALRAAGASGQVAALMAELGRAAQESGHLRVGLELARRAATIADAEPTEVARVEARVQLAESLLAVGDAAAAKEALAGARASFDRVESSPLRDHLEIRLALAESRILAAASPSAAIERLSRAIAATRAAGARLAEAELLARRAGLLRAAGDFDRSASDLERGLELLAAQSATAADQRTLVTARDRGRELFDELVLLALAQPDAADRVLSARLRLRDFSARPDPLPARAGAVVSAAEMAGRLTDEQAVVVAWTLRDEIVIVALTRPHPPAIQRLRVPRHELARRVAALRDALGSGDGPRRERLAEELSARILRPWLDRLGGQRAIYLLGDVEIEAAPWEILPVADGSPFGEEHELTFAVGPDRPVDAAARPASRHALVVADPAFDADARPGLERLPEARREGEEVAARFGSATLLAGSDATTARVIEEMTSGRHSWLHVAAHLLPGFEEPRSSEVLLATPAPGGEGGLTAAELARLDLRSIRGAVLSACGSALGYPSATRGALALSEALLEAGVEEVVATLWDVEDAATRELVGRLYDHLERGDTLARALSRLRASARASGDPTLAQPRAWGAFRLHGPLPVAADRSPRVH